MALKKPAKVITGPRTAAFFKRAVRNDEGGCWPWLGAHTKAGYGVLSVKRERVYAHRYAYTLFKGPIPEGLQLDHLCRNRGCCNPEHLEAVTRRENILRGVAPAAQHAKKTHCPKGHAYDRVRRGQRECKRCHADRQLARYYKHREAAHV
jgi:hypothetical protein